MPGAAVCSRSGSHVFARGVNLSSCSFSPPLTGKRTKTTLPPRARSLSTALFVLAERAATAAFIFAPKASGARNSEVAEGEEREPAVAHAGLEAAGPRALLGHAGAAFAVDGAEVGRLARRHEGIRAVRDRQSLEQCIEREVFLFQKSKTQLERDG